MKPRRFRIQRIYRHLTRRQPNRTAQWKQISQLRGQGKPGHVSPVQCQRVFVPEDLHEIAYEPAESQSRQDDFTPSLAEQPAEPPARRDDGGSAVVAALAVSLFLLGCAYAAFAGYVLSFNSAVAYLGVFGSVVSLLAAGIGVCMAASRDYSRFSGKFLSLSVISLALIYGGLLAATLVR